MLNWIKKLFLIVKKYDSDRDRLLERIVNSEIKVRNAVKTIIDRTTINADIHSHPKSKNQIIVVGRYRDRDYINVFEMGGKALTDLIKQLEEMEKYGHLNVVDSPLQMREAIVRNEFL